MSILVDINFYISGYQFLYDINYVTRREKFYPGEI